MKLSVLRAPLLVLGALALLHLSDRASYAHAQSPLDVGPFAINSVSQDKYQSQLVFSSSTRAPGSTYFGAGTLAALDYDTCWFDTVGVPPDFAKANGYSTTSIVDTSNYCVDTWPSGIAPYIAAWDYNAIARNIYPVPSNYTAPALADNATVVFGTPLTNLGYIPYYESDGDYALIFFTSFFYNPWLMACGDAPAPLNASDYPWIDADVLATIDCDTQTHLAEDALTSAVPYAGRFYWTTDTQIGVPFNVTEVAFFDELDVSSEIWYDDDNGDALGVTVEVGGVYEYMLGIAETYAPDEWNFYAVELDVAVRVFQYPVNNVFYLHFRATAEDLAYGFDFVPYDLDVSFEGGFDWIAANNTAYLGGNADTFEFDTEGFYNGGSESKGVSVQTRFNLARPFQSSVYQTNVTTPLKAGLAGKLFNGQLAVKVMDRTSFGYTLEDYLDVYVGDPRSREVCYVAAPAFIDDFGLCSNLVLAPPGAGNGTAFDFVTYDKNRMFSVADSAGQVYGDVYCYYAIVALKDADFVGNGSLASDGSGLPFEYRPFIMQAVRIVPSAGGLAARSNFTPAATTAYTSEITGNSNLARTYTAGGLLTNFFVEVLETHGVVYSNYPESCTNVVNAMHASMRANLTALLQPCQGAGNGYYSVIGSTNTSLCVLLKQYIASGRYLYNETVPSNVVCPQFTITPFGGAELVDFAYFFPYSNTSTTPHIGSLSLFIAAYSADVPRLCKYGQNINDPTSDWYLFLSYSLQFATNFSASLSSYYNAERSAYVRIRGYDVSYDDLCPTLSTTYVESAGFYNDQTPINRYFIPGNASAPLANTTDIQFLGVADVSYIFQVPFVGVQHAIIQRLWNLTADDQASLVALLVNDAGPIDSCYARQLLTAYAFPLDTASTVAALDELAYRGCGERTGEIHIVLPGLDGITTQTQLAASTKQNAVFTTIISTVPVGVVGMLAGLLCL